MNAQVLVTEMLEVMETLAVLDKSELLNKKMNFLMLGSSRNDNLI